MPAPAGREGHPARPECQGGGPAGSGPREPPAPREVVFALVFRGTAGTNPDAPHRRRAHSTALSQTLRTRITDEGVTATAEPVDGASAVLDSEVERFADGTFVEWGTITYGELGTITFETLGRGIVRDGSVPGEKSGAVIWTVTGGSGRLVGAAGLITSSFAVSDAGTVVDYHVARLWLPARYEPAPQSDPLAPGPRGTDVGTGQPSASEPWRTRSGPTTGT